MDTHRKAELMAHKAELEATSDRRELRLKWDNAVYIVNVPANDIRSRGKHMQNDSPVERAIVQLSASRSVRIWIDSHEIGREQEQNVTDFCQDVVILWHLGDRRVELVGPEDPLPSHDVDGESTYWLHVERESNADHVPEGHHRMTIRDCDNMQFYIPRVPIRMQIADFATYKAETMVAFHKWHDAGKKYRDEHADEVIGRMAQLALHGDPNVVIE